ncbi:Uncharacterised protein [Klebsiella variicola]|nr:hypothetical protein L425_01420 [Klebsiella quasipneumoniae subsp. quasipneumoniae]SLN84682.1 Uncharacterised protein [Klebsiella variicola]SXE61716.1 Uncharacterised protein [Klebsiella variicola]
MKWKVIIMRVEISIAKGFNTCFERRNDPTD